MRHCQNGDELSQNLLLLQIWGVQKSFCTFQDAALNHERHFKELFPSHRGICLIIFAGTSSFGMLMNPQLREVLCTKLLYMRFNAVQSTHKEI